MFTALNFQVTASWQAANDFAYGNSILYISSSQWWKRLGFVNRYAQRTLLWGCKLQGNFAATSSDATVCRMQEDALGSARSFDWLFNFGKGGSTIHAQTSAVSSH